MKIMILNILFLQADRWSFIPYVDVQSHSQNAIELMQMIAKWIGAVKSKPNGVFAGKGIYVFARMCAFKVRYTGKHDRNCLTDGRLSGTGKKSFKLPAERSYRRKV